MDGTVNITRLLWAECFSLQGIIGGCRDSDLGLCMYICTYHASALGQVWGVFTGVVRPELSCPPMCGRVCTYICICIGLRILRDHQYKTASMKSSYTYYRHKAQKKRGNSCEGVVITNSEQTIPKEGERRQHILVQVCTEAALSREEKSLGILSVLHRAGHPNIRSILTSMYMNGRASQTNWVQRRHFKFHDIKKTCQECMRTKPGLP